MLSRVSLRAVLVTVVASVIAATLTITSATAEPTAADLQAKIIETRQQINSLYMRAAAANEQVNGANYQLQRAEAALKTHQKTLNLARDQYADQREVVGALTVEQQLSGSTSQAMLSLLEGGSSAQILEDASSLKAIDEAMTAELDRLDAGRTVLNSASNAVEKLVKGRKKAVADRKAARARITAAIAQAEALEGQMAAERDGIVQQLAKVQNKSVEQVERELEQIEEQVDASGPGGPPVVVPTPEPTKSTGAPTTPSPATPASPTPRPTTPAPTTPAPSQPDPDPAPASSKVEKAIAFAQAQLGEKYSWGGAGPSKWDCSGLTMRAWEAAGIKLPHYAPSQYSASTKISVSDIRRGDLLFWSKGGTKSIYHVAMYLGNGKMIHAPRPGRTVEIVSVSYWIKPDMASRVG